MPLKLHRERPQGRDEPGWRCHADALPAAQLQVVARHRRRERLQPYMARTASTRLRSGLLSVKGKLGVVAPTGKPIAARFNGNVLAGNVRTVDRISGEDFLRWRALAVTGVDFNMDEAKGPLRDAPRSRNGVALATSTRA